jgi:hypothetical protein
MDAWTLHWLEASGSLVELRSDLSDEFEVAYQAISHLMPPPRLDVLIQRLPGETILTTIMKVTLFTHLLSECR